MTGAGGSTTVTKNIKRDATAPTVTPGNVTDTTWRNTPLSQGFTSSDGATGSGLAVAGDASFTLTASAQSASATTPTLVSKTVSDVAGNSTTRTVSALIDLTKPTITAATFAADGTTPISPNANGWFNQTVIVKFTCTDALSGVVASGTGSCPAPVTIASDTPAAGQDVSGSVTDNAGNVSDPVTKNVKVDKTAPTITATPSPAANAAGWNRSDVTVTYACSADVTCAGNVVVNSNTSLTGQPVSATVTDQAGNSATSNTVTVKLDKTAPVAQLTASGTVGVNGWYRSDVTFSTAGSSDALSGLVGCTAVSPITTDTNGIVVTTDCTDVAGNVGSASVSVKRDTAAPIIAATPDRAANANGWYNANVTLTFTCSDGGHPVSCPAPVTVSAETSASGQVVSGTATDEAGNTASASATIKLDKTAPTATLTPSPATPNGSNGWYTSPVSFTAAGTDSLSGGVTCTPVTSISADTTGTPVGTTCTDAAGNTASSAALSIKLDQTAPTITAAPDRAPNGNGWYNANVTVTFSCSDATSGVAGACPAAQTFSTDGNYTANATVTDQAGNSATSNTVNVHLDKTAPVVSGSDVVNSIWRNTDLSGTFTASDALSGLADTGDASFTLTASAQSADASTPTVVSKNVTDKAGNTTTRSLSARIDKTAPTATITPAGTLGLDGWYTSNVTFLSIGTDGLSGFQACSPAATLTSDTASHTATTTCTDIAGNSASASVTVKRDATRPVINATADRGPNPAGWYNANVTVTFTCTDATPGSEIASGACPAAVVVSSDTPLAGQVVSDTVKDQAGNESLPASLTLKLDKTAPTVDGPNYTETIWRNTTLLKNFTASDALSGLATDADASFDLTASAESADATHPTTATRIVKDVAGNSTVRTISTLIDKTKPTADLKASGTVGLNVWYTSNVTFSSTDSSDNLSGIASCTLVASLTTDAATHTVTTTCTDNAGNTDDASMTVKRDATDPTAVLNVAGTLGDNTWYTSDVSFTTTGSADNTSGLHDCTVPNSVTTDTASYIATTTCTDNAGNTGTASKTVKRDATDPTIAAAPDRVPNGNGWYNANVTVSFVCDDNLSGVVACPADETVSAEGTATTSKTVKDQAGNTATSNTVTVRLDKTKPVASITPSGTVGLDSWYTSAVSFIASGTDALSGPVSCTPIPSISSDTLGTTVSTTCTDKAGNSDDTSLSVKRDATKPTISATADREPNPAGWYNANVTVSFTCTDATPGSEIASGACPVAVVVSSDTPLAGQVVSGTATDQAGNVSLPASLTVKLDKTAPTATITPNPAAPNGLNNWYKSNVSFAVAGTDSLSGGVNCSTIPDLTTDNPGTTVSTTCTDAAGNTKDASLAVKMDKTFPVLTVPSNISLAAASNSQTVVTFSAATATDNFTSSISASCDKASGIAYSVGATTVTCSATDNAGNKTTKTFTITITYNFTGFFQPIDMSTGSTIVYNTVKAGSAVPVKFKLGGNQGTGIFFAGFPTSANIPCNATAPLDDIEETVTAGGSNLTYDATAGQYMYVWKTDSTWKAGTCRQLTVKFIDGTTQSAFFKFK